MEFGYPGANTHLENHGVSEESFWPSFTDIMMVIVMVFLLVTVAVILNNWSLIGDLKNSIQAQQIASTLAENRQQQNNDLGSKISSLEKKLVLLNEKYQQEKASLVASQEALESNQQALVKSEQTLSEKVGSLAALAAKITALDETLSAEKTSRESVEQKLADQVKALSTLQTNFETALEQKNKLAVLNKKQNSTIAEIEKEQQTLQQALDGSKSTIEILEKKQTLNEEQLTKLAQDIDLKDKVLASLQTGRTDLEKKVSLLEADNTKAQESAEAEIEISKALTSKLEALEKAQKESLKIAANSGKMTEDTLQAAQESLKESEEEKQRIIVSMNDRLIESEKKATALEESLSKLSEEIKVKDTKILAFEDDGNEKLRSLQGEYNSLDAKYQKLLRPARSSKGKFVVSVSYKNKSGKRIIRLKKNPQGSYKTVSKEELHKTLTALKKKHKRDLYLKVIIPETSGLSYNEAWKFTSNLQRKYDYYHQPVSKK